jgi:hypothetical protein
LLTRRLARIATRPDELERLRRHLVGIDLVAEQKDGVGPCGLAALQELGVRPERVDPELPKLVGPLAGELIRLGLTHPARADDEANEPLLVAGVDDRLRAPVIRRSDEAPVQADVVSGH